MLQLTAAVAAVVAVGLKWKMTCKVLLSLLFLFLPCAPVSFFPTFQSLCLLRLGSGSLRPCHPSRSQFGRSSWLLARSLRRPLALRMCGSVINHGSTMPFCHHVMCLFDTSLFSQNWFLFSPSRFSSTHSSCVLFLTSSLSFSRPPWASTSLSCSSSLLPEHSLLSHSS